MVNLRHTGEPNIPAMSYEVEETGPHQISWTATMIAGAVNEQSALFQIFIVGPDNYHVLEKFELKPTSPLNIRQTRTGSIKRTLNEGDVVKAMVVRESPRATLSTIEGEVEKL